MDGIRIINPYAFFIWLTDIKDILFTKVATYIVPLPTLPAGLHAGGMQAGGQAGLTGERSVIAAFFTNFVWTLRMTQRVLSMTIGAQYKLLNMAGYA